MADLGQTVRGSMRRVRSTSTALPGVVAALWLSPAFAFANDPTCCCTAHASTSCSDASCSATVCQVDPYCCSVQWDNTCASEAANLCGFAAPYCLDQNQNGSADICEGVLGGPQDCNGNGIPDVNEAGFAGISYWIGATSGQDIAFDDPAKWSGGRPGTATTARVTLPYSQYYSSLELLAGCDNAINTLELYDYGTQVLHDFALDLGGNTLRVAGPFGGFRFTPSLYYSLRPTITSGTIDATDSGLYLVDDGALEIKFIDVEVNGGNFGWASTTLSVPSSLTLESSTLNITGLAWPSDPSFSLYPTLELRDSTIQFPPAAQTLVSIPDSATLHVVSGNGSFKSTPQISKLLGGPSIFTDSGSLVELDGHLMIDGTLTVGGTLQGRSHCLPIAQYCSPSTLVVQQLVYPTNSSASFMWGVDLSGNSGTTPDGDASIRVPGDAWIDGTLFVNNLSNGEPLLLGFSVPLIWSGSFVPGHDNFDVVRAYDMDQTQLPLGYYVTTERVGDTIQLVVKRSNPIASTSPVSSPLPSSPFKMVVVDDGTNMGGMPLVAHATPTGQGTLITLRKIDASSGTTVPYATINALSGMTDMIAVELSGGGLPELVVSHGAAGIVRAYSISPQPTILWTTQLPAGVRPECLCVMPPSGSAILPTSTSIGVGSSSGGKGGFGTISGSGIAGAAIETAVIPTTVNGTDIDDDGDSDVVAGGESSGSSLMPSAAGAIQVIRREASGGFTPLPTVPTAGVPSALAVADLDGDGLRDVVASCGAIAASYPSGSRPTGVALRGAPASGSGSTASLLRPAMPIDVGSSSAQGTGIELIDADADGALDIVLSWQDGSPAFGGAAVVPVREQRVSGGLTLGSQLQFAYSGVSQLRRLTATSVVTLRSSASLTGGSDLVQDDFAAAPIEGDFDGDGYVTNADVALMLLNFGPCEGVPCVGDLDFTGEVDTGDLAYLLLLFG